jgi:hypothetical protein
MKWDVAGGPATLSRPRSAHLIAFLGTTGHLCPRIDEFGGRIDLAERTFNSMQGRGWHRGHQKQSKAALTDFEWIARVFANPILMQGSISQELYAALVGSDERIQTSGHTRLNPIIHFVTFLELQVPFFVI